MHFKMDVRGDGELVKQTQKKVDPYWQSTEESCDEKLWLRTEKLLRKRVGAVPKELVPHCLVAHPVNLPLGNGMKYSQIRLVVFTAVDFPQIKKMSWKMWKKQQSRFIGSERATETKAAGVAKANEDGKV